MASFDKILTEGGTSSSQNSHHRQLLESLGKDLENGRESYTELLSKINKGDDDKALTLFYSQIRGELDRKQPIIKRAAKATPWSNGELSTLIYGIMRLGEKEFTEIME